MLKIGDFSNLAHVSIKTLHHYDQLGLLKPAHIDRFSGYRYYSLGQLATLNRILALKDLGLTLEQVAQLLHDNITPPELRGMLRLKQLELSARLEEEQARLVRVEQRLRQLEQGDTAAPCPDIAIKQVPAQTALTARIVAANEGMLPPARQSLQAMLSENLEAARLRPAGPWFALLDNLPFRETDLELTLGVAVELRRGQRADDWNGSPIHLKKLPAAPAMASLVHEPDGSPITQTYTCLHAWTQANGYQFAGLFREIYLPETGASAARVASADAGLIEVQCPVEKVRVPLSIRSEKEENMQPQIVEKPAFKTVGLSYIGKNQNDEIGQLWDRFIPRITEPKRANMAVSYGLCFSDIVGAAEGDFEYLAAVEVADDSQVPAGMVCREVPAHKYAVFTHHGKLGTLPETYHYIYNTAMPQSGLQLDPSRFDMEVYDQDFEPGADDSKLYIYVAIQ